MVYTEIIVCKKKRTPEITISDDEGRGSSSSHSCDAEEEEEPHLSPPLKSDVNKLEKNMEEDPEFVPKKWHWNWPDGKLIVSEFKKPRKFIRDRKRYGYSKFIFFHDF